MLILNSATISAIVFAIWREHDSTEVVYTWEAAMERTIETWSAHKTYSSLLRTLLAMTLYTEMEKDNRLN